MYVTRPHITTGNGSAEYHAGRTADIAAHGKSFFIPHRTVRRRWNRILFGI